MFRRWSTSLSSIARIASIRSQMRSYGLSSHQVAGANSLQARYL
jgi:hypothetical protein